MNDSDGFEAYARARQGALFRFAYLLCGDRHLAEDLVQTTFLKTAQSWRRIKAADSVDGYVRRTLVNCFLDDLRKRHPEPREADRMPEPAAAPESTELRLVVREALAGLPPRCRAVLVLRFFEDLSVEQTADVMGIAQGTVKSQTAKALNHVRAALGPHSLKELSCA